MLKRQHPLLILAGFMLGYGQLVYAEITMSHSQVTDVTPSGFSVLWHASEASTPRVEVYLDAAATQEITDQVEMIPFPLQGAVSGLSGRYEQAQSRLTLQQSAKQKGLNKIRVRGLDPETEYFIKVFAESAGDSGSWPATGTQSVTTQRENAFLQNSAIVVVDLHDVDSRGWLVTASVATSTHPVSSFADAGAEPGQAVINLSNLFGGDGTNWYSDIVTSLTIQVIKGSGEIVTETLDIDLSGSFEVASNYAFDIGSPFDAIIQIVAPAGNVYSRGESVNLAWTDEATDVNATISLYMDVDSSGEDGVLVVSGIAEDPDGVADQYNWDVSAVAEGSYYVYAVMSDGVNSVTSYGDSKITIDHNQTDGDSDLMSDLWEMHYFDTLARDGTGDFEGDTVPDWLEGFYLTNPEQTNSPLPGLILALKKGAQIIGVPGLLVPRIDSYELLAQLGSDVFSIARYNPATRQLETTYWDAGAPEGDVFFLLPGAGYFVQMIADVDLIWSPFNSNRSIPLRQGVNVIAITQPSGDSFGLLGQLGSDVIWSIRRQNSLTSLYETAAFDGTEAVGIPFPLRYGEGYIVTVKQDSSID